MHNDEYEPSWMMSNHNHAWKENNSQRHHGLSSQPPFTYQKKTVRVESFSSVIDAFVEDDDLNFDSEEEDIMLTNNNCTSDLNAFEALLVTSSHATELQSELLKVKMCNTALDVHAIHDWCQGSSANVLVLVGLSIWEEHGYFAELCPKMTIRHWIEFFQLIAKGYHENSYHNEKHAADVMYSMYCLLTFGKMNTRLTPLQLLTGLLAAACHDIGHLGTSNANLVKTKHPITDAYPNTTSPLEAMHLHVTLSLLRTSECSPFRFMRHEHVQLMESWLKKCIPATDLGHQSELVDGLSDSLSTMDDQIVLLCAVLQASDLGHCTKPRQLHHDWARRICLEVNNKVAPTLGDSKEYRNYCASQLGFIRACVCPLYFALHKKVDIAFAIVGLEKNIEIWQTEMVQYCK